jgi:hypothetical protein
LTPTQTTLQRSLARDLDAELDECASLADVDATLDLIFGEARGPLSAVLRARQVDKRCGQPGVVIQGPWGGARG